VTHRFLRRGINPERKLVVDKTRYPLLEAPQQAFLGVFAVMGNIGRSAQLSQVHRQRHYDRVKQDAYELAFTEIKPQAAQLLVDEAIRRADEGVLRPVYQCEDICLARGGEYHSTWRKLRSLPFFQQRVCTQQSAC